MRSTRLLLVAVLAILLSLSCGPIREANALLKFTPSADTFLDTSKPDQNYGSSASLQVEGGAAFVYKQRSLLKFDLSSIPIGYTITEATLRLYVHGYGAVAGSSSLRNVLNLLNSAIF